MHSVNFKDSNPYHSDLNVTLITDTGESGWCRWCSDRRLHSSDKQSDVKVDGYTDGFPVTLSLPSHWSLSPSSPSDWLSHDNICTPICQYGQRLQRRRCLRKTSCYGRKLVSKIWNPSETWLLDSILDHYSNFSHCKVLSQKPKPQHLKYIWPNKLITALLSPVRNFCLWLDIKLNCS